MNSTRTYISHHTASLSRCHHFSNTARGRPLRVNNLQLGLAPILFEVAFSANPFLAILRTLLGDGIRGHGDVAQLDVAGILLPVRLVVQSDGARVDILCSRQFFNPTRQESINEKHKKKKKKGQRTPAHQVFPSFPALAVKSGFCSSVPNACLQSSTLGEPPLVSHFTGESSSAAVRSSLPHVSAQASCIPRSMGTPGFW